MALNKLALLVDLYDGTPALLSRGSAVLNPSVLLTDSTNNLEVPEAPVWAQLNGLAIPSVTLLATDNATLLPSGWAWVISFRGVPGNPASYDFFLPAAPQTFTANNASPCVFTASGAGYVNNTGVQLSGGSLPAPFQAGVTYWTVSGSGATFELAATAGGSPIASTGTGSGSVIAVSSYLSSLSPVSSVTTMAAYMPLPSGTPGPGQVPVAAGTGEASAWGTVLSNPMTASGEMITGGAGGAPQRLAIGTSGQVLSVSGGAPSWQAGGLSNPMTTLGDTLYGGAAGAAARLAGDTSNTRKFLREQSSGGVAQAPAWDTLQSGDIPANAANTSGTAAGLSVTLAVGQGGTGAVTQQAALDALAGAVTAGQVLRGNGTHVQMAALQAGDIPDLAYVDTVTAADSSVTVTGAADAPSLSSVPAQYAQRIFAV